MSTTNPLNTLNAQSRAEQDGSAFDFQRYLQVLFKRKWLIVSAFLVTLGMVAVWTFSRTRIYQGTTSVLVEKQAPQVLGKDVGEVVDLSAGTYFQNRDYMETQRKVITSRMLAGKVVERLKLMQSKAFWGDTQREKRRKPLTEEDAIKRLLLATRAVLMEKSNIIEISVEHPDAEMAARLANAVAQAYLDQNVDYKLDSTAGAVKWLADQVDDLKKQLEDAERALHEFKKQNNIVSVSLEDKQSLIMRQIEKLDTALTETRMQRMALEAKRKQVTAARQEKDPLRVAIDPVMENGVIKSLKTGYVEELKRYMGLRERYLERHPLVLEQRAKVEALQRDLAREVNNVLTSFEARFDETRDNEHKLAAALQEAKNEALEINAKEVDYRRLERTQQNTARLYQMILTRMKESDLSSQLRVNNIRLLDRAIVPMIPIRPNVRLNLLLGALLGLMFGIGLALLIDAMDTSIKSHEDVEAIPHLTYLGLMPRIPGSPTQRAGAKRPDPKPELDLIVHREPKSVVAESCRAIRTNLMFSSPDRPMRRIVVSSANPREGKTTTAVSIAVTMAQAGNSVLIIDTDMRRPRLHKVFGVPGADGVASVLLGSAKIDDVIKTTEVPGLYVLPCGPTPPNPAELCQSDRFKALLDELSERFDRVILDSPPVMLVTDAAILSTLMDGCVIVARSSKTSRIALRESVRQITDVGGHMLGCVLNDMDLERGAYGQYRYRRYGYRYGRYRYGYGYGGGYGYGQYGYGEKEEETPAS